MEVPHGKTHMELARHELYLLPTYACGYWSHPDLTHLEQILREAVFTVDVRSFNSTIVIEMSRLLGRWVAEMKHLLENLSC